ncbi:MAG: AP2 domain-containing protein [Proteobacteria bacterium]|nr:AP2 domain-containing protein [Pseudomonadota bacterium]
MSDGLNHKEAVKRLRWVHKAMLRRCCNPNAENYRYYGGRGISVCEEWKDFEAFLRWALPRWELGLSLDRVDNDAGYCPENCRYVTSTIQLLNRGMNKNNTSGHKGVSYIKSRRKWKAQGVINGEKMYLGVFKKKEDAIAARKEWERAFVEPVLKKNYP